MNTTHPPVGPTEQEVRAHFGAKLNPVVNLIRPAYTSIWALEDGTLLWDWKNGYSNLGSNLKCIMYITGPAASGKTHLVGQLTNAVEVSIRSALTQSEQNLRRRVEAHQERNTAAFTSQRFSPTIVSRLKRIAEEFDLSFININLTR